MHAPWDSNTVFQRVRGRCTLPVAVCVCGGGGVQGPGQYFSTFLGLHGHPTNVKMDVSGAFARTTGYIRLIDFPKVDSQGKHRFGPVSADEVIPKVKAAILPGGTIMSDGIRAYRTQLQPLGYTHAPFATRMVSLCLNLSPM